jgi:iron complex outermembrane receptor protein
VVRGADGERRNAFYVRAKQGALSLSLVHSERHKGAPLVPDAVYGDSRASDSDAQSLLDLDWSHPLGEKDSLALRASAGRYRFVGLYAFDHPPVVLNRDDAGARWGNVEARWTSTRWDGHQLALGAQWQHSGGLFQRNTDLGSPDTVYLDDRRSANRGALFAEDQWALGDGLALNLAGRWDRVQDQPAHFSPRLALLWHATPALVIKALHGRSWRPPNAFESYYEVPGEGGYKRNPGLRSETVTANELALEWRPGVHDRFSASLYHQRAERLLALQRDESDGLLQFRNFGALQVRGFEAEYERLAASGLRLRANLSLQQPHGANPANGVAALGPRRMAKATLIVPLPRDWSVGLEAQAVSRRGPAAGHALAHLTLSTPLALEGPSLLLGVRNLFDRRVDDPGYDPVATPTVPQRGRSVIARLEWAF